MLAHMADYIEQTGSLPNAQQFWTAHPMMRMMYGEWGSGWSQGIVSLWILTWILVVIALIAFIRWMWKKGDKVK